MKDFKIIDKSEVWSKLHEGKRILAVVLYPGPSIFKREFDTGIHEIRIESIRRINYLIDKVDNVEFYEEL